MKTNIKRAVSTCSNGNIRLHPSLTDRFTNLGLCLLFVYLGAGLFLRGLAIVSQADEGVLGGIFLLFFSLLMIGGSITIATFKLREIGTIHIKPESREILLSPSVAVNIYRPGYMKRSGKYIVPFGKVDTVGVSTQSTSEPPLSSIYLTLEHRPESKITLTQDLPVSDAQVLAMNISAIISCKNPYIAPPPEENLSLTIPESHTVVASFSTTLGRKIFPTCSILLMAVGLVGFLGAFFIAVWGENILLTTELPLGSPSGIAVNSKGKIYVGSRSYMRIQRYSTDGQFDRAWHVRGGKGDWRMYLDDQDRLVLIASSHFTYRLNDNDQLLKPDDSLTGPPSGPLQQQSPVQAMGPNNSIYQLHRFPVGVSRRGLDSGEHLIFRQGFFMTMLTGPFPAFIIFISGIIMSLVIKYKK